MSQTEFSERSVLPTLTSVNRKRLMNFVNIVNCMCQHLCTNDLKETVDLMFAAAQLVTDLLGVS